MRNPLRLFLAPATALVLGLATLPVVAQSGDETEVSQAVEAFRQAMVAGDGTALTALAHPSLQFGHSNGVTQTREEFVKTVVDKTEVFRSVELTDRSLAVIGDMALERHVFNADILLNGKPLVVSLGLLETWQRQTDGRWLLLARQAYNTKAAMPQLTGMSASNEPPRRAGWTKSDETEVAQAVEAFRKAMVAGDGEALTALASPNLSFGHSNGVVQSREVFVGTVVRKEEVFRNIALTNKSLKVVGDTAIQRHVFNADILLGDKPLVVSLGALEVWHRQADGRWLLLARQAYNTNPPNADATADASARPMSAATPMGAVAAASSGAVAAAAKTAVSTKARSSYAPSEPAAPRSSTVKSTINKPATHKRNHARTGKRDTVHVTATRETRKPRRRTHTVRSVAPVDVAPSVYARPTMIWPGDGASQRSHHPHY